MRNKPGREPAPADAENGGPLDPWVEQVRRGGLELAILLSLVPAARYGLEIIRRLSDAGLVVAEGTIYPILARLTRDGVLRSEWREEAAHPRKYYSLTPSGRARVRDMTASWQEFTGRMSRLVEAARGGADAAQ